MSNIDTVTVSGHDWPDYIPERGSPTSRLQLTVGTMNSKTLDKGECCFPLPPNMFNSLAGTLLESHRSLKFVIALLLLFSYVHD